MSIIRFEDISIQFGKTQSDMVTYEYSLVSKMNLSSVSDLVNQTAFPFLFEFMFT